VIGVQAVNPNNPSPIPARLTRGFAVKVVGPAPMTLTARPASKAVTPGGMLALELSVDRREGFAEAVAVVPASPLPGMGNNANNPGPAVTIPKTAASGTYALTLPRNLAPGVYTLVFQGTGPYPFSKDEKAKTKPNVTLTGPSNPVTLVVRPAPAAVALTLKDKTLKAGKTVEVSVTVTPKDKEPPLAGPIAVSLAAPSALKLSADPVTAEPGKPAKLVIQAAADSPPGAAVGLAIRASVPVRGEPVEVDEPLAVTIAK
jgi:hypothetical protein